MDIKNAIDYAEVALNKILAQKKTLNKDTAPEALGDTMWLIYYNMDEYEVHEKACEIINKKENKKDD